MVIGYPRDAGLKRWRIGQEQCVLGFYIDIERDVRVLMTITRSLNGKNDSVIDKSSDIFAGAEALALYCHLIDALIG